MRVCVGVVGESKCVRAAKCAKGKKCNKNRTFPPPHCQKWRQCSRWEVVVSRHRGTGMQVAYRHCEGTGNVVGSR